MREIQQRVRNYEMMAVFAPDVTEEELPGAIDRVGGYIETAGGTIVSTNQESPWGRRRLAYPIRYQGRDVRDGYYVLYYFDIQSTQVAEIEREIGLNDKLIRHILTIRGEIPAPPEAEAGVEGEAAQPAESPAPEGAESPAPQAVGEPEEAEPASVQAAEARDEASAEPPESTDVTATQELETPAPTEPASETKNPEG